jgi:hypothetical protein
MEIGMKKLAFATCAVLLSATPSWCAPWVRSFVVANYEPAFYYGGKVGTTDPGSDCPKGAVPDNDYRKILVTPFRSAAEVYELTRPVSETGRDPITLMDDALAHRGFRSDIETYINPFGAPDPGFQQVTGTIAEGFDLDNNPRTGGFTSPGGQRGIDNAFYRVLGCHLSYRGEAYKGYLSARGNDKMLDGLYTMVIRISGNQDPMNDPAAKLEIGYSPDRVVKDAMGNVTADYSFRLAKSAQYTAVPAKIRNGVVETAQIEELRIPNFAWYETNRGEALFRKGRVRLVIGTDGNLSGLLGGYRDYRDVYARDTFNVPSGGQSRETTYYQNQIGYYYALKRNADGLPDPRTGELTGISVAYRLVARPAFVVDPAMPAAIDTSVPSDRADQERAMFWKGVTTKAISPEIRRRRPAQPPAPVAGQPPERSASNAIDR